MWCFVLFVLLFSCCWSLYCIVCPSSSNFSFLTSIRENIDQIRAFNFTYRYIENVLSINNSRFEEFLPLIYPPELEVKETTDTASSASFLDVYLEFDDSGQLSTKIYDKRDDFNFNGQHYTSFSCISCLHLAIDSLCKGQ